MHLRPLVGLAGRQIDLPGQHLRARFNQFRFTLSKVDRSKCVLGEDLHGPLRLVVDAGCFQVGNTPIGKLEPGHGQVFVGTKQGHAHGIDIDYITAHQREDQVEIMDHQVEHDTDVGRTERVGTGTDRFDVLWGFQFMHHGVPGRIEAFHMAHLQHELATGGDPDQVVCFGHGAG